MHVQTADNTAHSLLRRKVLEEQSILRGNETEDALASRVADTIFSVEERFGTPPAEISALKDRLKGYMAKGVMVPGMPALRNAGREQALASCVIVPVNLQAEGAEDVLRLYYRQNMGSGFDVSGYQDPVDMLAKIDNFSDRETQTGIYARRLSSMVTLDVTHPRVDEFIKAKREDGSFSYANISVVVTNAFMQAVKEGGEFPDRNGKARDAKAVFHAIAENAWLRGDPGMIFSDQLNRDNPLAVTHPYVTVPPCAETGLAEGEACYFAYINLAKLVKNGKVGFTTLREVTAFTTRMLDDEIEFSAQYLPLPASKDISERKRKMGISVSGAADMLIQLGIPYTSDEGRRLIQDIAAVINYQSKRTSVDFIKQGKREPNLATLSGLSNQEREQVARLIEEKFIPHPTGHVSAEDWQSLAEDVRQYGIRNIGTTALPPGGTVAFYFDTAPQIEPMFNIFQEPVSDERRVIKPIIVRNIQSVFSENAAEILAKASKAGSFQDIPDIDAHSKEILKTAAEISVDDHIAMVAKALEVSDESASKTINLPQAATVDEVEAAFMKAYESGLKSISVYVDKSKMKQPRML